MAEIEPATEVEEGVSEASTVDTGDLNLPEIIEEELQILPLPPLPPLPPIPNTQELEDDEELAREVERVHSMKYASTWRIRRGNTTLSLESRDLKLAQLK